VKIQIQIQNIIRAVRSPVLFVMMFRRLFVRQSSSKQCRFFTLGRTDHTIRSSTYFATRFTAGAACLAIGHRATRCEQPLVVAPVFTVHNEKPTLLIKRAARWTLYIILDLFRGLRLVLLFSPCLLLSPLWWMRQDWWLTVCVGCIQRAGPTFIKLGQWASTRADLFSLRIRKHLRKLQDQCLVESEKRTLKVLKDAFHDNIVLENFEMEPLGSGCIAQVHRATLNNEWVAVKVQRRNVKSLVERDLSILARFVWLLNTVLPRHISKMLELQTISDLFSEFMTSQLDFHIEAENLEKFNRNFRNDRYVRFPKPLLVSQCGNVLVMSLEPGLALSSILYDTQNIHQQEIRKQIGHQAVQMFLKMVLVDNFVHSDLHPGNILVNISPKEELLGLTLLDVGLVASLSDSDRRNFVDLFAAVAVGDGKLAGELMVSRASPEKLEMCVEKEKFIEGIDQVVRQVNQDSFRLDKVQIGSILENVLNLVRVHRVPLDPNFTSLILSIIVLEGLGRQLNPELDIFKESIPILMQLDAKMKILAMKAFMGRKRD